MPKAAKITTSFSGGELSPFLLGRVDVSKFQSGVARMENWHPVIQGGALSRPGTRYIGMAKGRCRLIPFVVVRQVSYQIELGDGYLRIWRADGSYVENVASGQSKKHILSEQPGQGGGGPPLELVTPYPIGAVPEVTYEQAQDTMFLFHKDYPVHRLQRLEDTLWRIEASPFVTAPFSEQGESSSVPVTLSGLTGNITATAQSAVFVPGDVGRDFESGTGSATITGFTSATVVSMAAQSAFSTTAVQTWGLSDSPAAFLAAAQKGPVGAQTQLSAALARPANIDLSGLSGSITVIASDPVFSAGDNGRTLYADTGKATLTYVSPTQCSATTTSDFLESSYQSGGWGVTGNAFRGTAVGGFVRLNGGLFEVTGVPSASLLYATIRSSPTALVAAPPGSWSLETPVFGAGGYPRCGALHEQRLYMASTVADPQTVMASRVGEYLDFEPGLNDADGFSYTLNSKQRNPVQHLVSGKRLFAFTTGMEASLRGGNEKAIGPTNIQKENESEFGCNHVRPVVIGKEVLYAQGASRKIRALGFSAAVDGFDSPDRTVFAEHITASGVADMAYQAQPHSLLYCVRNDGQMAVAAYDVSQEVIAWSRFTTAGKFLSVSVIPYYERDDVWVVVDRPVNGVARYVIERMEEDLALDCASTFDAFESPPTSVMNGLSRFTSVRVKADDADLGELPVAGGAINLGRQAHSIEAGIAFVPTIEMLPPDLGGADNSYQGSVLSVNEMVLKVLNTSALELNGEPTDFRQFGADLLDRPPPPFTGDYKQTYLVDDVSKNRLVIRQPYPFKACILSVVRKLTANDT